MRHIISVLHVLALLGGVCVAVMVIMWFCGWGQVAAPRSEPPKFDWPKAGQTYFYPSEIYHEVWEKNPVGSGNRAPLEVLKGQTITIAPLKIKEVRLEDQEKPPEGQRRRVWTVDAGGGLFIVFAMVDEANLGRLEGVGVGDTVSVKGVVESHWSPPHGVTLINPEFTLIRKAGG